MVWEIYKKSVVDFWEEMLYLVMFNFIWIVGSLLIIPGPFVTFALFFIAKDVGEGRGINFGKWWDYGRHNLKSAYIWGGINFVALILFVSNIWTYGNIAALWAAMAQLFFISVLFFWLVLQLIVLGLYPRLVEPSFKLAMRNAAILAGRYPMAIVATLAGILLIAGISLFFVAPAILGGFAFVAVLTNSTVELVVKKELDRLEEHQDQNQDK